MLQLHSPRESCPATRLVMDGNWLKHSKFGNRVEIYANPFVNPSACSRGWGGLMAANGNGATSKIGDMSELLGLSKLQEVLRGLAEEQAKVDVVQKQQDEQVSTALQRLSVVEASSEVLPQIQRQLEAVQEQTKALEEATRQLREQEAWKILQTKAAVQTKAADFLPSQRKRLLWWWNIDRLGGRPQLTVFNGTATDLWCMQSVAGIVQRIRILARDLHINLVVQAPLGEPEPEVAAAFDPEVAESSPSSTGAGSAFQDTAGDSPVAPATTLAEDWWVREGAPADHCSVEAGIHP
eukprot:Skav213559  [mRNA]  locus=scaffold263:145857:152018:+ [translate_table: standard]